ncbi:hypothetical protein [Streptomyces sp. NPDC088789]|uniref:DUF7544 domain-containing protein n=1 Tax=Streptomyces sp. NPDC088789 TaxID=3365899 RepID=UPI003805C39B
MNDTPGWASPGSAPSDGPSPGTSGPTEPADRPVPPPAGEPSSDRQQSPARTPEPNDRPGADQGGTGPQDAHPKWSKEQPPPAQWSAPTGPRQPGQAPPPPPPGTGWGTPPPNAPGGWTGPGGGYGAPHGGHHAPGGPGGYGQGPYGPGGWGTPWGGPPPAAKPGVIPLRPVGVGEILDGAVSTMRTYWRTVLGISLTVAVLTQILVVVLQGTVLDDLTDSSALDDPSATTGELTRALGEALAGNFVLFLVSLIGTIAATALLTTVTSRAVLGKPVTTAEAWRDARPQTLKLFGLIFLLMLIAVGIVGLGTVPSIVVAAMDGNGALIALSTLMIIGAAVVALFVMVRFSLAPPALMLEKQGILKAMRRSARLVRGSWWRVFGILLLAMIITYLIAMIIAVPFALFASLADGDGIGSIIDGTSDFGWTFLIVSGIGSVIGSTITLPIMAGVTVLLYIDQRIRREALDLDLARAAGVQSAADTAPRS